MDEDDFFNGFSPRMGKADRRFMLGATLALLTGAGFAGAGFAMRRPGPSEARWDQGAVKRFRGVLIEQPYPTLLRMDARGTLRPMLLVGYGKIALPRLGGPPALVEVEGSVIARGPFAMVAVRDAEVYRNLPRPPASLPGPAPQELGPVTQRGEILDAKCWFGAMNPGEGLTHKACAGLCARGRLPLSFCALDGCGDAGEIVLFLDEAGRPHGREVIPYLAEAVLADGRMVRRNGFLEYRVGLDGLTRV